MINHINVIRNITVTTNASICRISGCHTSRCSYNRFVIVSCCRNKLNTAYRTVLCSQTSGFFSGNVITHISQAFSANSAFRRLLAGSLFTWCMSERLSRIRNITITASTNICCVSVLRTGRICYDCFIFMLGHGSKLNATHCTNLRRSASRFAGWQVTAFRHHQFSASNTIGRFRTGRIFIRFVSERRSIISHITMAASTSIFCKTGSCATGCRNKSFMIMTRCRIKFSAANSTCLSRCTGCLVTGKVTAFTYHQFSTNRAIGGFCTGSVFAGFMSERFDII